jgi:hypothetical protein
VHETTAAAADLLAARGSGRLPRVREVAAWLGASVDDARRADPELVARLDDALLGQPDRAAILSAAAPILLALVDAAAQVPRPASARWPRLVRAAIDQVRLRLHPERDDAVHLPRRIHGRVWILAFFAFVAVYTFMWSVVHVIADRRRCMGHLADPLHHLVPLDMRFSVVTRDLYVVVTLAVLAAMLVTAALVDHRPIIRFALALAVVGLLRSATILLVPLCRVGVEAGTAWLAEAPRIDLGPLAFMWRPFASNDLLFSGHMAESILAIRATRSWPRPVRAFLWLFLLLQGHAMLATRGHYTVDILVAIPMACTADRVSVVIARELSRRSGSRGRRPRLDRFLDAGRTA